jgi:hypothetical protein
MASSVDMMPGRAGKGESRPLDWAAKMPGMTEGAVEGALH